MFNGSITVYSMARFSLYSTYTNHAQTNMNELTRRIGRLLYITGLAYTLTLIAIVALIH